MAPKVARLSINPNGVDRISNLPDAVLCHILSYLSTKYSVRTRILSTRWKYLFTSVPVLDFSSPLNCYTPETIQPFLEFVNFVFNSYNVDRMDRFSYSSSSFLLENDGPRLASWIQDSVNRGVRELRVVEILNNPQTLPQNLFTSKTISFLYIHGNFVLDVPDNVWLPCVRNVDFLGVTFLNNDSVRRLFQSFPVLENLFLNNCSTENIQILHICIPSLLSLKIHGFKDKYELVLDVPNVKYFEYHGFESLGFSTRNELKSLANASVSFPTWSFPGSEALPRLVSIVSHVQEINICAYTLEAFRRFGLTLPTFHNLTHLELRVISSLDFELGLLVDLLDRTPHLEVLLIDNGCSSEFEPSDLMPQHVPMCVSTHLKVIEIKEFSLLVNECTLVKYFLKNAKVLHTLYIETRESLEKQFEISKKLLTFSRCSRDCQVILDSVDGGLR